MSNQVDLNKYQEFVEAVTSKESNDSTQFVDRFMTLDLDKLQINTPLMLTGAVGLCAESGELIEIVKKMLFQGKPLNEENLFHMKRELGDIMWYWINTCRA